MRKYVYICRKKARNPNYMERLSSIKELISQGNIEQAIGQLNELIICWAMLTASKAIGNKQ